MEIEIHSTRVGDVAIVSVAGEVDVYTAPKLKESLLAAASDGGARLVVDLRSVGFIDSSGLGVLVGALRRSRERDGWVRLVCSDDNVLKVLGITGLDKVFAVFSTVESARES